MGQYLHYPPKHSKRPKTQIRTTQHQRPPFSRSSANNKKCQQPKGQSQQESNDFGSFQALRQVWPSFDSYNIIILRMAEERRASTLRKADIQGEVEEQKMAFNSPSISQIEEDYYEKGDGEGKQRRQKLSPLALKDENQASSGSKQEEWTIQQERQLMSLHNQKGNKWVEIARLLHRSDNSVKNHYHSKLRKALRKINKCITDHLKSECKPFKNNLLSRIVQTAEVYHSGGDSANKRESSLALQLKNDILALSELSQQQISVQQITQIRNLISLIAQFNKKYKKQDKPATPQRLTSNKYKGKEIISLLSQNTGRRDVEVSRNDSKEIPESQSGRNVEQPSFENMRKKEGENLTRSDSNDMLNNIGMFNNFYFYKPPVYPLYFSVYPQTSGIFSGKTSSFTFYQPESDKMSEQMTTWASMAQIDWESGRMEVENEASLKSQLGGKVAREV